MRLKHIESNYAVNAFRYRVIGERNKALGWVLSARVMDTGKDYETVESILSRSPCIYIGGECPRFSSMLTKSLNFEYVLEMDGGNSESGKLVKTLSYHREVVVRWSSNKVLGSSCQLLNSLLAFDSLPIGACDKNTFEEINRTYPLFNLSMDELKFNCALFKHNDVKYTFVYRGYVLDGDYQVHKPQTDGHRVYFILDDSEVYLDTILNYRINNLSI